MSHLANHVHHSELRSDNTLHVVTVLSNVERYESRYRLARDFIERMEATKNVKLYVVEAAFGDRHHEVTKSEHGRHCQLRIRTNAWIKENLINVGVRCLLPCDWRYVAWVDADIEFRDSEWAQEAMHQLQHFKVIQPWQTCADLSHSGKINQTFQSFGYLDQQGVQKRKVSSDGYPYGELGHPGYAWAATRGWWEQCGGLLDTAILGAGDRHMAWGCVGSVRHTVHKGMTTGYLRKCVDWQNRAVRVTNKEVGYSAGRIEHHWHGAKVHRGYKSRWQILIDRKFDPYKDLMYDDQGILRIVGKPELEKAIRAYNRSRAEDGIFE